MIGPFEDAPGVGRISGDSPPPTLGQHSEEILAGLGQTGDEIQSLRMEKAT